MRIYLLTYLFGSFLSCQNKKNNHLSNQVINNKDIVRFNIEKKNKECLKKSDSLSINTFIVKFINDIENDKPELISKNFNYPLSLFDIVFENELDFKKKWKESEAPKAYLTLMEYDEDDNYLGKGAFQKSNIFYFKEEESDFDDCFYVQYHIGNKVFIIKKIKNKIKITTIDGVG